MLVTVGDVAADARRDAAIAVATENAEWDARQLRLTARFERILVAGDAALAAFKVDESRRIVVGIEWTDEEWEALDSTVIGPSTEGFQSVRPSEHRPDRWTVIVAGLAPVGSLKAAIVFAGDEHVVPVLDRLYLFALGVEGQLDLEPLSIELRE
jgi:hypothetical protein